MKIKNTLSLSHTVKIRSTLLIPSFLFLFYVSMRDHHGGLGPLLGYLLNRFYLKKSKIFLNKKNSTMKQYQDEDLNLKRVDFRVTESDWANLKLLAGAHNLSMCAFFVVLLTMEMAGVFELEDKFDGAPTHYPNIIFSQSMIYHSTPIFTLFFQFIT